VFNTEFESCGANTPTATDVNKLGGGIFRF
jgi:hypothetical protein